MKSVLIDNTFHLLQVFGDFQIGLVLRLGGPLDQDKLRRALSGMITAFPVLGCAFVPCRREGRWEKKEWADSQLLTVMPERNIDEQIQVFFTDPVNPYTGPQIKCLLLEGDQNCLCLNVSHFVADAAGVKELAYWLCRAYNSPELIKPIKHERGLDILRQQFPGWRKLGILKRTIQDLAGQKPFPPSATLQGEVPDRFDRRYVIRPLDTETTRHLQDLAVGYQATTNDVLMAAFIRSLNQFVLPGKRPVFRLVVTADLRRHLLADKRSGQVRNLSGWVFTDAGRDPGRNLEETCGQVSMQMNRLKKRHLGMGLIPVVWLVGRTIPLAFARWGVEKLAPLMLKRIAVAPSFTNMGRIDHQTLVFEGRAVEEAFLLAPIVYAPILGVGISQFQDTMTLSSGFNVPGFTAEDVTALLDGIVDEVRSA